MSDEIVAGSVSGAADPRLVVAMKPHCSLLFDAAWLPAAGPTRVLAGDRRPMQMGRRVFSGPLVGCENLASEADD